MKQNYKTKAQPSGKWLTLVAALGFAGTAAAQSLCSSAASSTADEEIYNVMVNGVNTNPLYSFSNGCSTPAPGAGSLLNRYSNFMSLGSSYTVTQGVVSTFSVQENECDGPTYYNNGCAIWIDYNQNGVFTDPGEQIYVENVTTVSPRVITGTFVVPFSATTGTTTMRVIVAEGYSGAGLTPCLSYGYGETEDYIITVNPGAQCAGTPASNTIVATTTLVCPVWGTTSLGLANTYTLGGINYQWQQSTNSALGPWTPATGTATQSAYASPTLAATMWYQVVATCVWGGVSQTVSAVQINVATTTTNTAPYFEGFEGITTNNMMPNCSWWRSDFTQCSSRTASVSTWRTARTGNKFAEFDASNAVYGNTRYFYSNGIVLNAGITYSASVWYNTPGYSSWYNLGLLYGPNQSPSGLVQLATIQYPNNNTYNALSNTFSVATTNTYYLAVKATEYYYGSQLVWDDLAITVPCQFSNNGASISLTGTTTVCAGQSVNINAAGASSYSWSTGQNSNAITVAPLTTTTYSVAGVNPLSGCVGTASRTIVVNQLPSVGILAFQNAVCQGKSTTLQAFGASSYTWSNSGANSAIVTVTPNLPASTYSVVGADMLGCSAIAVQAINVNPLPVISVTGNTVICQGYGTATLSASGAGANGVYQWASPIQFLSGSSIVTSPQSLVIYTVTGVDANNCTGSVQVPVAVDACTGIQSLAAGVLEVSVYPNPSAGVFAVSGLGGDSKTIEVTDFSGRKVKDLSTVESSVSIDLSGFANGVYFIKVKTLEAQATVKVVKQ